MRRFGLASSFVLVLAAIVALPGTTATAALTITVDADGVLAVSGDDEQDRIVVRCDAGNVIVSGQEPMTGSTPCSAITGVEIAGGGGRDTIRLHHLDPSTFSAVTSILVSGDDEGDTITGSPLVDQISGGAGRDSIEADPLAGDVLDGGDHIDFLAANVPTEVVVTDATMSTPSTTVTFASIEALLLTGTPDSNHIDTRAFTGRMGINGGKGDDVLLGSSAQGSSLSGGNGDDTLIGGSARDSLSGGRGDDVIRGRGGAESVYDVGGNDRYYLGDGNDSVEGLYGPGNVLSGGEGRDEVSLLPFEGTTTLSDSSLSAPTGSARLSSIELVVQYRPDGFPHDAITFDARRFSGRTILIGTLRDDVLLGGLGRDLIQGSGGNDRLTGSTGHDGLDGGEGTDSCDGGPGNDELVNCE